MNGEPDVIMAFGPLVWLAGAAAVKGISNLYGAYKSKRAGQRQRRSTRKEAAGLRTAQTGNIAGLEQGYLDRNKLQQGFIDTLQRRSKTGGLPVQELVSQVGSRIGEFARQGKASAVGFAASRGLEGSGIQASLTGRVDATSMQAIGRAARAIRIQNENTKIQAQNDLGRVGDRESDLRRDLANRIFSARSGRDTQFYGGRQLANSQYYQGLARSTQYGVQAIQGFGDAAVQAAGGLLAGEATQASDGTWWQQMNNGQWKRVPAPGNNSPGIPAQSGGRT